MAGNAYLAAALDYAARGWRVVPLHPRDKRPRPRDWPNAASADPAVVRRWWGNVPDGNVGVALGSRSGLVGIDIDTEEGSRRLAELAAADLPDTPEMTTGKGSRLLFAIPDALEFEPKTHSVSVPGPPDHAGRPTRIEILRFQGVGGQCVMPPSVHPSGRGYAWVEGRSPADLEPAPMPGWLVAAMRPPEPVHPPAPAWADRVPGRPGAGEGGFNQAADWWDDILLPAGFTPSRPPRGDRDSRRYCRPGKGDHSVSVTVGYYAAADGTPALYVFSSSIHGLEAGRCYDKFGAFARLFHRGNFTAARAAAVAHGLIRQTPRRQAARAGRRTPAPRDRHDDYPDPPMTPAEAARWLATADAESQETTDGR